MVSVGNHERVAVVGGIKLERASGSRVVLPVDRGSSRSSIAEASVVTAEIASLVDGGRNSHLLQRQGRRVAVDLHRERRDHLAEIVIVVELYTLRNKL